MQCPVTTGRQRLQYPREWVAGGDSIFLEVAEQVRVKAADYGAISVVLLLFERQYAKQSFGRTRQISALSLQHAHSQHSRATVDADDRPEPCYLGLQLRQFRLQAAFEFVRLHRIRGVGDADLLDVWV